MKPYKFRIEFVKNEKGYGLSESVPVLCDWLDWPKTEVDPASIPPGAVVQIATWNNDENYRTGQRVTVGRYRLVILEYDAYSDMYSVLIETRLAPLWLARWRFVHAIQGIKPRIIATAYIWGLAYRDSGLPWRWGNIYLVNWITEGFARVKTRLSLFKRSR